MAITSGQLAITTTATAIDGVSTNPYRMRIQNNDNTKDLFIGGPDVSITNGLTLRPLEAMDCIISPNEQLFVISSANGHNISWLRIDV
jgi:hypothetical protein